MESNKEARVVTITEVTKGESAREKIKKGVDTIADAVKITLGARGRNVVIEEGMMPHLTKDGVTVANSIFLDDPIENMGVQMLRQAAHQTVKEAGDGTTTSIVLAQAMVNYGLELIKDGGNPIQIQREMQEAAEEIVNQITDLAQEASDQQIRQISIVSTNGDEEIGNAVAEAYIGVGVDGVISLTQNKKDNRTYSEVKDGMCILKGYAHGDFINDQINSMAIHHDANILVVDQDLDNLKDLKKAFQINGKEKPIIIIARDFKGSALGGLAQNFLDGTIKVLPIKAPGYGEFQKEYLSDFAVATGATLISPRTGLGLNSIKSEHFGFAKEVRAEYSSTTIVGRGGSLEKIEERMEGLKVMIDECKPGVIKEAFEERLRFLKNRFAYLYVGASSEIELKEKIDRIDDALGATKVAIEEGIVPGGGVVFYHIGSSNLSKRTHWLFKRLRSLYSYTTGADIVYKACLEPILAILSNGGLKLESKKEGVEWGINVRTGEQVKMIEEGIIDPAKVLKCCIRNATSVASSILTTGCTINNKRK